MKLRLLYLGLGLAVCFFGFSPIAKSENKTPMDLIKTTIESAKQYIISNKAKLPEDELKAQLENIIRPAFDFKEMAKKCLASNWSQGTAEQQQEFVDLFSSLLSRTYMNKVLKGIEDSMFSYPEEKIEEDKALVKTKVENKGDEISIDYRMQFNNARWSVYDVIIENVGLVSNYRTEFSGIIRKEGFDGLIKRLREKKANPPVDK